MKRKIQHDAVNKQEDEDSSTCPVFFLSDGGFDKKKKKPVENRVTHFLRKASGDKDESFTHLPA
jgi:hypothetical protein